MRRSIGLAAILFLSGATSAWPCTVVGPLPSPQDLVARAEVIVRVRVDGLSDRPGRADNVLAVTPRQVRFTVLGVLKGSLASTDITLNGLLEDRDDQNDRPVPYDFVRPGGRGGNCYALRYQMGSEYLLLLRSTEPGAQANGNLSPYWAALSPTNEQLNGETDPWLIWVGGQVERNRRPGA